MGGDPRRLGTPQEARPTRRNSLRVQPGRGGLLRPEICLLHARASSSIHARFLGKKAGSKNHRAHACALPPDPYFMKFAAAGPLQQTRKNKKKKADGPTNSAGTPVRPT